MNKGPVSQLGRRNIIMNESAELSDFIRNIIKADLAAGRYDDVHTRFPPEPNGYLHIGHVKAIAMDFGVAEQFGGKCNLRFDDTNPAKEEDEYVEAIKEDIHWLGFDWEDRLFFASDYFDQLYEYALVLIKDGKAYVDDLSAEEIRDYRGTLTKPGQESPYRNRSVEENLNLFEKMRAGEFKNGEKVLRAKIDMAAPNMNLRDPVMYRILHETHHRTGDKWCIYPMYDWAHGQSDSIEGVTYSLCSIEFKNHRPLYDWFLDELDIFHPQQLEFARFNMTYTVMSKRKLIQLVEGGHVNGWDDPRMITLAGMRRLGITPEAIRAFIEHVGVGLSLSTIQHSKFDYFVRDDLNQRANRVNGVLNPLKVVLTNYPEDQVEMMTFPNHPDDNSRGVREVAFTRELFIEQDDFMEDPPQKFWRLAPGREVRLRYGYLVTCTEVVKDGAGEITEIHCTIDPESKGGTAPDGREVKGTLHWVSASHAIDAEVRLYDRLFRHPFPLDPKVGDNFLDHLNPDSLQIIPGAKVEPSLKDAKVGEKFQFERVGYFCVDPDTTEEKLVFNRTIALRDSWAKIEKQFN
ncbi:MAG: glutamine--tRNA ligase/YqeY domain fusion protein [Anaerolineales bacterium]|nr:glutamine--tRNA ligase/YqeY domain fusion protein [Anaerolineales bacterium]